MSGIKIISKRCHDLDALKTLVIIEAIWRKHSVIMNFLALLDLTQPTYCWLQVIKAFIVLAENYQDMDQEELIDMLRQHAHENLEPTHQPRKVEPLVPGT